MINNQKEEREMMRFEKTAEFGSHTIFSSTNHADPLRAAEIVEDHDFGGMFVAQIFKTDMVGTRRPDGEFETIGIYDTFDEARRNLECQVTFLITHDPDLGYEARRWN